MANSLVLFDRGFNELLKYQRDSDKQWNTVERENKIDTVNHVNRFVLNLAVPYSGSRDEPPGTDEQDVACSISIYDLISHMIVMQAHEIMGNIFEGIALEEALAFDKDNEEEIRRAIR